MTSKNECFNSPIHEFKVLQNVFKIKTSLKMFFKVIDKNYYTIKKEFEKALWLLCSTLNSWIGGLENSFLDATDRLLVCLFLCTANVNSNIHFQKKICRLVVTKLVSKLTDEFVIFF